jgi:hypothetical protein
MGWSQWLKYLDVEKGQGFDRRFNIQDVAQQFKDFKLGGLPGF